MNQKDNISIAKNNQRIYAAYIANLYLGKKTMSKQAKTLNEQELRRVLDYIATRNHASRNRAMLMTTFLSGMRVGEVAALKFKDVVTLDGEIKNQILLTPEMTKGSEARIVYVNDKLKTELAKYLKLYKPKSPEHKFFYTQKNGLKGFSANTLTQHFHYLYKRAGIDGASSHSGRRSFITNLANKGVGVRILMNLAGHKNIGTTQAYIDVNEGILRSAVELI